MILERLGKCVEALDVIRGPLGGTYERVCSYVCVLKTEVGTTTYVSRISIRRCVIMIITTTAPTQSATIWVNTT